MHAQSVGWERYSVVVSLRSLASSGSSVHMRDLLIQQVLLSPELSDTVKHTILERNDQEHANGGGLIDPADQTEGFSTPSTPSFRDHEQRNPAPALQANKTAFEQLHGRHAFPLPEINSIDSLTEINSILSTFLDADS